ncbi:hypothetical protein [Christiangramia aestuarii]|uniref:Uncharacterized protein n=1 Tax=Christiangramia aestuarii TaxID=1028746 RepID=A0A7K1LNB4_9FLAO|nr:hypothetical protein [Christiangramia aestuarii]MUP42030.1 hypothetical protein [Christiangramia aestuarii]
MKRLSMLAGGLLMISAVFTSCRDTNEKEVIVKEVEVEKKAETPEEAGDKEGILERTAKEVDKEINKEIDEEIEKIGDDN